MKNRLIVVNIQVLYHPTVGAAVPSGPLLPTALSMGPLPKFKKTVKAEQEKITNDVILHIAWLQ